MKIRKRKKVRKTNQALRLLLRFGITAAVIALLLGKIGFVYLNHSNLMAPAVRDGDLLIFDRLESLRSDAVVAYRINDRIQIGRVVGKPGDVIELDVEQQHFRINGSVPMEYIFYDTLADPDAEIEYPYQVPADSWFLLNDSRESFSDSRTYGAIPSDQIIGVLFLRFQRRSF